MKFPFVRTLTLAAAIAVAWNCSEEAVADQGGEQQAAAETLPTRWIFQGDVTYVIVANELGFTVLDGEGNAIGAYDVATESIIGMQGEPLAAGIDLAECTQIDSDGTVHNPDGSIYTADGTMIQPPVVPESSSSETIYPDPESSADIALSSASIEPTSAEVDPESSANVEPARSSSSVKSSSSAKSSSSVKSSSSSKPASSASDNSRCPNIQVKGGASGSGWATRYWDCCAPHCSWPQNTGYLSKTCDSRGKNPVGGGGSICSGGGQTTCTSHIPFTIDGCTDMAFAFAAVPASNGGDCGKCFQLTFKGTGKYSTDANHKAIKGKKLIIMTTNIGGDVQQGQFDILIPGGGFGMFNGCSQMGWNIQNSEQYGGLLSDCEKEKNYKAAAVLTCLQDKCKSSFGSDEEAKKGCMFLADWMHAAGNPEHDYVEVECPQELKQKY